MPYITKTIRSVDLTNNLFIGDRTVTLDRPVYSLDVNQIDGTSAISQPYEIDGSLGGTVSIYPQSVASSLPITVFRTFNRVGNLYGPSDAKFDYLRQKLWIADTCNHRVLKVNLGTSQVDLAISTNMVYPHALAVELNTGNLFVKAYESLNQNNGAIFYYQKDGLLLSKFAFNNDDYDVSSSSSSLSRSQSQSESSSSGFVFPTLPSSRSIVFDHTRSRVWWVDNVRVYMADIRNKQVQTFDIRSIVDYLLTDTISINVEFATGNVFVVVKNIHNDSFILQISRDNNLPLGVTYVSS